MRLPTKLTITDDSGFLGIVDANAYKTFVSEDWELPQLLGHFVNEMNNNHLVFWATNLENTWTVNFAEHPSDQHSFREFHKTLEVTNGKIFLTNYEDLTMAAQFANEKIPAKHNADLELPLPNGLYTFLVRQLFDAENPDEAMEKEVHFEIVMKPSTDKSMKPIEKIFWMTE
ncbi:MAG: hypothetical protein QM726_14885 [Chitinophagaceae bacterium]